jgi:hypothetical protein
MKTMITSLGALDEPLSLELIALLRRWGIELCWVAADEIPGSYWGAPEAGLRGSKLYARPDTPVHSILHEACHYRCMDADRRATLDTDAGGDDLEESAVCYLSIVAARELATYGAALMLEEMDAWGYSFRLGSARAWFEQDAEDAARWLREHSILGSQDEIL